MKKFKVGDWVIDGNYEIAKILNIKQNIVFLNNDSETLLSKCELWQPKEGEWCWFWNGNIDASPLIGKYGYLSWTEQFYNDIEPFIGELPSF